jgi:hypothetical protein
MDNVTPFPEPLPGDTGTLWLRNPHPVAEAAAPAPSRQQNIALWIVAGASLFIAICVFVGLVFIINRFRPPPPIPRAGASAIETPEMREHYAEIAEIRRPFAEIFPEPLPDKPPAPPRNPLDDLLRFADTVPLPTVSHPHQAAYRIAPHVAHHSVPFHYWVPRESFPSAAVPIGCPASLGAGCLPPTRP